MDSRRSVAALAFAALVVTSGCIGFVTGEEALTYEANEVDVSDDAKRATGFEEVNRESVTVNRTVQDREVRVTNSLARYEKYDDIAEQTTGVLAVFSTHRVDVFGHTTNPFAEMTYREVLRNATSQYGTAFGSLEDATFVENRTRTVLGQEARVGVFETETEFAGETVAVRLYVTRVQHGDDLVIAIGGHPKKLPAGEQEVLRTLSGIEHSTDENATTAAAVAPDGAVQSDATARLVAHADATATLAAQAD
jgi:hypothetical protein